MRISERYSAVRKNLLKNPGGKNAGNLSGKHVENSDPSYGAKTNKR